MRKWAHRTSALAVTHILTFGISPLAGASGFSRDIPSARHLARAGAVIATVDDPSAIYYNPAGLASTMGTEVLMGLTTKIPSARYTPADGTPDAFGAQRIAQQANFLPHIFLSRSLSDKAFVGFGFYQPYDHQYEWQAELTAQTRRYELTTYNFSPTVALKLSRDISVAVGISVVPATLNITQPIEEIRIPAMIPADGIMRLESSAFGIAAIFGVQVVLARYLKLGAAFHSGVELSFAGNVNFDFDRELSTEESATVPRRVITDMTLPHVLSMGLSWDQGPLTIELSGRTLFWEVFDEMKLEFTEPRPPTSVTLQRDWQNMVSLHVGLEYRLRKIAGRLGASWASSPIPTATIDWTTSAADELQFACGLGYDLGLLRVDVGYLGALATERALPTNREILRPNGGTFESSWTHRLALSLGTRL